MSRIQKTFDKLKPLNRTALATFIMAGDPDMETSFGVLQGLPEAGADIIEIGMPFTDPAADGLTIQKAGQRALKAGMTLSKTLQMITNFREENNETPIILMGYANPLFAYGLERFAADAAAAGIDGLIIVDLPPEEDGVLREHTQEKGIDMIRLVTPTTDEKRLEKVLDGASGFLYYVSITGVTGTAKADMDAIKPHIDQIKTKTDLPVAVGFGIKTPADAKAMSALSDAVVVGSAIVAKTHEPEVALSLVSDLSAVLGSRGEY